MSDEYQLRKDIDRTLSNIYNLRNGELIVVRFGDESKYRDKDGNYLSIDTILNDFYDKPMIYTKEEVDNAVNTAISQITDKAYPIGSIYMSVNDVNPSELFGGEWEQIQGRFLLASGDLTDENDNILATYNVGDTDGNKDAVVVSHSHSLTEGGNALSIDSNTAETTSGFANGNLWGDTNKRRSSIASNGVSGTDKNMPPYIAVNMWKRIA